MKNKGGAGGMSLNNNLLQTKLNNMNLKSGKRKYKINAYMSGGIAKDSGKSQDQMEKTHLTDS